MGSRDAAIMDIQMDGSYKHSLLHNWIRYLHDYFDKKVHSPDKINKKVILGPFLICIHQNLKMIVLI